MDQSSTSLLAIYVVWGEKFQSRDRNHVLASDFEHSRISKFALTSLSRVVGCYLRSYRHTVYYTAFQILLPCF